MDLFPENLEAILFDAGGTLVRVDTAFISEAAAKLGFTFSDETLAQGEAAARRAIDAQARRDGTVVGTDAARFSGYFRNMLEGAGAPLATIGPMLAAIEAGHAEANLWRVPLEGAFDTLQGLRRRGVRMAVVSNGDGRVRALLSELGMTEHLEFVIDSHEEGVEKPDPAIFRRAVDRLGVAPERAAYIGDIYSIDAVGAHDAGLRPILIDPTGAYASIDCQRIGRLLELVEMLDETPGREQRGGLGGEGRERA